MKLDRALGLISLIGLAGVVPAHAQETHVGQKVRSHVPLVFDNSFPGPCALGSGTLLKVLPDGRLGDEAFRVPDRNALVVTDVDWSFNAGGSSARASAILLLLIQSRMDPNTAAAALQSTVNLNWCRTRW